LGYFGVSSHKAIVTLNLNTVVQRTERKTREEKWLESIKAKNERVAISDPW
jgi:hypothetical protein